MYNCSNPCVGGIVRKTAKWTNVQKVVMKMAKRIGLSGAGRIEQGQAPFKTETERSVRLAVIVPESMRRDLKKIAAQEGTTILEIARTALSDYLEEYARTHPENS